MRVHRVRSGGLLFSPVSHRRRARVRELVAEHRTGYDGEIMLRSRIGMVLEQHFHTTRRRWISSSTIRRSVMSFGDGSHGALGLPSSLSGIGLGGDDAYEPTCVPGLPSDVTAVAAGHYHSLAFTSQGELWAWGRNREGQLGRGPPSSTSSDSWNEPRRVEGLDKVKVCGAFASGVISAAIGDDGSLWVWGKSKRGQLGLGKEIIEATVPSRIEALAGEKIVKVSLGWGHALAQTEDGKLFGWGYSADGRLGRMGEDLETSPLDSSSDMRRSNSDLSSAMIEAAEKLVLEGMEKEKDMPIVWEPSLVNELHGSEVADIACGLDHSLVLCCDGTLLSCGSNIYGQLGRVQKDLGMLPVDISFHSVSIAAGVGHSLAICEAGGMDGCRNIHSWGWNQSCQLGRVGAEKLPMVVKGLEGEAPVSVSAGRAHSIALSSKGEVWVWGCGRNGRLGLGSSGDENEPVLLDFLGDCEVLQAVAGFDHNLVLVAD